MRVDLSLSNAKVYDIERFDVVKGQKFSLLTDWTTPTKWLADEDQVLDIKVTGNNADVEALDLGKSEIWITEPESRSLIKVIFINVVAEIIEPAKTLGVSADNPVPKT